MTVRIYRQAHCVRRFLWAIAYYLKGRPIRRFFSSLGEAERFGGELRTRLHIVGKLKTKANVNRALPVVRDLPRIREIVHFSAQEVKILFGAARPEERSALALALFVGLRPGILHKLPHGAVNVSDQSIFFSQKLMTNPHAVLLETVLKTDGRDWRGPPPVLWRWLEHYPLEKCDRESLRKRLKQALGGKWIDGGCRHTAATHLHGEARTGGDS